MFFKKVSRFPQIQDNKIEIIKFLEASKGIVTFVELLGTVFIPVKSDIKGNIEKLQKIHLSDEVKFPTLNDIVEYELQRTECERIGIDALLWLKRALEYINVFLQCFLDDKKQGHCSEDLSPFFHKAYEEKLKPYHGWIVQKLFGLMVMAAPSRKSLLQLLDNGTGPLPEEEMFHDIELFLKDLNENINAINELYETNNLTFSYKV